MRNNLSDSRFRRLAEEDGLVDKEREEEEDDLSQGVAAEEEEVEEGRRPVGLKSHQRVSKKEREEHNLTHCPYRSWCKWCIVGRGKDAAHHLRNDSETVGLPLVQLDYFFLSSVLGSDRATGVVVVCTGSGAVCSSGIPGKSRGAYRGAPRN